MYLTLTLLILFTTIIVFFVDDFVSLYKKIIKIPGVKLWVPLLAASWLAIEYDYYLTNAMLHLGYWMELMACRLATILPLSSASLPVARIMVLSLFSILPSLALALYFQRNYKPLKRAWFLMTVLFVFFSMLLLAANIKLC